MGARRIPEDPLIARRRRRIVVATLLLWAGMAGRASAQLPIDLNRTDQQEVDRFAVTIDLLKKTVDVNARLVAALTADRPWLRALALEARQAGDQTIGAAVTRTQGHPQLLTLLGQAGLEPRMYIVGQLALMQAVVASDNVKAGLARAPRPDAGPLAHNVALIDAQPELLGRFLADAERIITLLDGARRQP